MAVINAHRNKLTYIIHSPTERMVFLELERLQEVEQLILADINCKLYFTYMLYSIFKGKKWHLVEATLKEQVFHVYRLIANNQVYNNCTYCRTTKPKLNFVFTQLCQNQPLGKNV